MPFERFQNAPQPNMPTRSQFGLTGGEMPDAIGQGIKDTGKAIVGFNDMLERRAEAKRKADIEARKLVMEEETHKITTEAGKLKNTNDKIQSDLYNDNQAFLAGAGPDVTELEKINMAEQSMQLPTKDAVTMRQVQADQVDEENAKHLIDSGKFKDLMKGMSAENGGKNLNLAVGRFGSLIKTKTAKEFIDQLKTQNTYHQAASLQMLGMNDAGIEGLGSQLADSVKKGLTQPTDAVKSILRRGTSPAAAQKQLLEYGAAFNDGIASPQLLVQSKNASNPALNRQIIAIDALTPNLDKIIQLSDEYGKLSMPALNKALNSGSFSFGGSEITDMQELQKIIAEEAGNVFGVTTSSDFKIKLGGQLVDLNLSNPNFKSTMNIFRSAVENKKQAINDAQGIFSPYYVNPNTTTPLSQEEALQYLKNAGGDRDLARANAKKDRRTF